MKQQGHLELWGGLECTINRVQDAWFDQFQRTGHLSRPSDFDLIHDIGIRTLRYGLHWERAAAAGSLDLFEGPLRRMRELGLQPIVGLVHHGSGPAETDLLDPGFPGQLARYASLLARRNPWIELYTPINEPQTTARFSGLYGHWYPHHRSFRSYVRALTHQLKASVLAMRAIREIRSDARFIHTEDAGKTWSSASLSGLCFEREQRRWLGLDLLCGRVDDLHPLFPFLREHGLTQAEILWFSENACPPDVVGLNYYVTSDRFLDDRLWLYTPEMAGGDSGHEPLVDMEAVRVHDDGIAGAETVLLEAWERYGIPVAITEAHLGGPVDDQRRWLLEIWQAAQAARRAGVNCIAVTAWAMLGSFDWCSLVTRQDGIYEPGLFDLRSGTPQPTPLAALAQRLARGESVQSEGDGWWRRRDRLLFEPAPAAVNDLVLCCQP